MTLRQWIINTGPKEVAKLCNVDPSTVSAWKVGKAFPRPKKLLTIHKISKGRVSYKELVEGFVRQGKS